MSNRAPLAIKTLAVGVILNLILGAAKIAVGLVFSAFAITADAANSFSDAAVGIVTVFAFAMSAKRADKDHPLGHGRLEYVATLFVGAAVFAVAIELVISSVRQLLEPSVQTVSPVTYGVLGACIGIKLFLAIFYTLRNRNVKSDTLRAAATDSFSDVVITSSVLIGTIVFQFSGVAIDGYLGIVIGAVIAFGAVKLIVETANRLIGSPDPEAHGKLNDILLAEPQVSGYHDLIIHDYGSENKEATAHIELDGKLSFAQAHEIADRLEDRALETTGIHLVLHCDPIGEECAAFKKTRGMIDEYLASYSAKCHDLSIHEDSNFLSFDVTIPESQSSNINYIKETLLAKLRGELGEYDITIHFDIT